MAEADSFAAEKAHLISEIATSLGEVVQGMRQLNSNLQSLAEVGQDFDKVAETWQRFHSQVAPAAAAAAAAASSSD